MERFRNNVAMWVKCSRVCVFECSGSNNMNDQLKKIFHREPPEGTEIHRILTVWLENKSRMLDFQIFQIKKEDDFKKSFGDPQ